MYLANMNNYYLENFFIIPLMFLGLIRLLNPLKNCSGVTM